MKKQKLLLVDDDEIVHMTIQRMLVDKGFDAVIAESGKQAIEKLEKDSCYDLVITDLRMPGITGLDVFNKVLETNVNIPVMVMSGFSEDSPLFKEAIELKPCSHLLKPFTKEELLEKIHICLKMR